MSTARLTFWPVHALVSTYAKPYLSAKDRALSKLTTRICSKSDLLPHKTISGFSQYACVYLFIIYLLINNNIFTNAVLFYL